MKLGTSVTAGVVGLAACGMVYSFLANASPYVTVKQAMSAEGDSLHLAGDLDKNSVRSDLMAGKVTFQLKDVNGDVVPVIYEGAPPANMGSATKVVAVGKMDGETFRAHKLLVKCPSKYEGEKTITSKASSS